MPPSPSAGDRSSPDRSPDDRSPEDLSSGNRSTDGESPGDRSADDRSADDRFADDRPMAASLLAAGRVLRDRPGAILPAYLLALGVIQVASVPVLVGLAVALASLSAAGRLEPVFRELPALADAAESAGGPPAPTGPGIGGGVSDVPPEAIEALSGLVTPVSVGAIALGIGGSVLVWVLARVVTGAVTQGTVWAAIDGRAPLADGLATAGRWRTFLGLLLLRVAVLVAALLPAIAVAIGVGGLAATGSVTGGGGTALVGIGALLAVLLAAGGVLVGVLGQFVLLFAGPAIVVEDRGTLGAARASVGFVRDHLGAAIAFGLVVVSGYVVVAIVAGLLSVVGAGRVVAPLVPLVLSPLLDTGATALYAGEGVEPADRPATYVRVGRAFRRGVTELGRFPRKYPLATLFGGVCLAGAIGAGYLLTAPSGVSVGPPGGVSNVFGAVPIDTFATLAVNNWVVSARLAFGGVVLGVPAVVGLGFNGVLVGALAGVYDPVAFLALVAPHGVLELPTVALAGGLGVHLGRVGWRALRGRADPAAVADELQRAGVLLVGIAVLLVVAAFVEAFVTPWVAAAVIG
jgi:uncharacterized membrane protein SpoIIM required for sporulation